MIDCNGERQHLESDDHDFADGNICHGSAGEGSSLGFFLILEFAIFSVE